MARTEDVKNQTREKIVDAIDSYWNEHGYAPTIRDLCRMVPAVVSSKQMSTSVMNYHLDVLEKNQRIVRDRRVSRTIRLVDDVIGE